MPGPPEGGGDQAKPDDGADSQQGIGAQRSAGQGRQVAGSIGDQLEGEDEANGDDIEDVEEFNLQAKAEQEAGDKELDGGALGAAD